MNSFDWLVATSMPVPNVKVRELPPPYVSPASPVFRRYLLARLPFDSSGISRLGYKGILYATLNP